MTHSTELVRQWTALLAIGAVVVTSFVLFTTAPPDSPPRGAHARRTLVPPEAVEVRAPAAPPVASGQSLPGPALRPSAAPMRRAPVPQRHAPAGLTPAVAPALSSRIESVLPEPSVLPAHTFAAATLPIHAPTTPSTMSGVTWTDAGAGTRRGAVTAALSTAGTRTGRAFRRVGQAFSRAF